MSLSNPRILVIEDEPSQVELLRYNLRKQGFDVRVAMDGEERGLRRPAKTRLT